MHPQYIAFTMASILLRQKKKQSKPGALFYLFFAGYLLNKGLEHKLYN